MMSMGPGELTLVLVTVVLVFIAGRLAPMGDALGRMMGVKPRGDAGSRAPGAGQAQGSVAGSSTKPEAEGSAGS